MEILTFVLEGALAHTDSLGTGSTILPGDLQRMSAGTGIVHSEFNQSKTVAVHFLQIWVLPRQRGLPAGYEQKSFDVQRRSGKLCRIASGALRDGAVGLQQDLELFTTILGPGQTVTAELRPGRFGWLQVARGALSANGTALAEGDGAALVDITTLELRGSSACEALLFDLP